MPSQRFGRTAAAFTTPRKASSQLVDDTTEVESSPVVADSEASPAISPSKSGKGGLLHRIGKGEMFKPKSYSDAVNRRISKRRRRDVDRDVKRNDHSEAEGTMKNDEKPAMGVIPSILTFIDLHPNLPNTLSTYIQFILNCFFAFCFMYVLYGIFATIRNDIDERAMMESSDILAEMAVCAREFKDNRCERDTRVPAMESVCNSWEKCMSRDPYLVGRSRLSAGMFAEIFNSFIEPISIKAIVRLKHIAHFRLTSRLCQSRYLWVALQSTI